LSELVAGFLEAFLRWSHGEPRSNSCHRLAPRQVMPLPFDSVRLGAAALTATIAAQRHVHFGRHRPCTSPFDSVPRCPFCASDPVLYGPRTRGPRNQLAGSSASPGASALPAFVAGIDDGPATPLILHRDPSHGVVTPVEGISVSCRQRDTGYKSSPGSLRLNLTHQHTNSTRHTH